MGRILPIFKNLDIFGGRAYYFRPSTIGIKPVYDNLKHKESIESLEDDPDKGFLRRIKSFFKRKSHLDNSNDLTEGIHDLMDEGQAKGLITNEESHMVYGVLDLKETKAHSIMVSAHGDFVRPRGFYAGGNDRAGHPVRAYPDPHS